MSFSSINPDSRGVIVSFAVADAEPNNGNIKQYAREIMNNIAFINHECEKFCEPTLKNLKHKFHLFESKYSGHNLRYRTYKSVDPECAKFLGNPQLLNALWSGGHFIHSPADFTLEIGEDIKAMIHLMPKSVNYCLKGAVLHENFLLPFTVAAINDKMPLDIIEFLLQKGTNIDKGMEELRGNRALIGDERFKNIVELVNKYAPFPS